MIQIVWFSVSCLVCWLANVILHYFFFKNVRKFLNATDFPRLVVIFSLSLILFISSLLKNLKNVVFRLMMKLLLTALNHIML